MGLDGVGCWLEQHRSKCYVVKVIKLSETKKNIRMIIAWKDNDE